MSELADLHAEHARYLWGLGYRLLGSSADAEDLVQDTFLRALERPPADRDRPWRPWLTKVAVNLGRDLLRPVQRTDVVPQRALLVLKQVAVIKPDTPLEVLVLKPWNSSTPIL